MIQQHYWQRWYRGNIKVLHEWLGQREDIQLHIFQLKTLIKIFKKMFKDFELQGVLNVRSDEYKKIHKRLTVRLLCSHSFAIEIDYILWLFVWSQEIVKRNMKYQYVHNCNVIIL